MTFNTSKDKTIPIVVLLLILMGWAAFLGYAQKRPGAHVESGQTLNEKEELAQLGDAFGVLNSLLSVLAVFCALYTITQQSEIIESDRRNEKNKILVSKIEDMTGLLIEAERLLSNDYSDFREHHLRSKMDDKTNSTKIQTILQQITILGQIHFPELNVFLNNLNGRFATYNLTRLRALSDIKHKYPGNLTGYITYLEEVQSEYNYTLEAIYEMQKTLLNFAYKLTH